MSKKKEDNRDVFEKIMDEVGSNPLPFGFGGAAALGGVAGRYLTRRAMGKRPMSKISQEEFESLRKKVGRGGLAAGAATGAVYGGLPLSHALSNDEWKEKAQGAQGKKRRK